MPITLIAGWAVHFAWGEQGELVFDVALALSTVALPATIGIAILRHRLFDIELVLSRTLTYLLLVVSVVATYALLLVATDRVFGNGTVGGLLAVGVVAVAVHPAHSFLRRRIERWVYGLRSEPLEAIRLLADRAEAADPEGLIDAVTATVAEALRADRARIGPVGSGVPLLHRGERLGDLAVDLPRGGASPPRIGRYSTTLLGMPQCSSALSGSLWSCASRAAASWQPARRSGDGFAATCTTE